MKKTKKNQRRKKRKSIVLLLFLTIIMFGTATYAWFTANEVVTINDINVQVDASIDIFQRLRRINFPVQGGGGNA
jgi:predicted ribosomally synthesized peptide with SipW-like signal peptide